MRQKYGMLIATALGISGITILVANVIDSELKRHRAEKAKRKAEMECVIYKFCDYINNCKIKDLEEELKELKSKGKA